MAHVRRTVDANPHTMPGEIDVASAHKFPALTQWIENEQDSDTYRIKTDQPSLIDKTVSWISLIRSFSRRSPDYFSELYAYAIPDEGKEYP